MDEFLVEGVNQKRYRFKIPIGDWSDDGHGKHEDYLVESNKPIEHIRELYFQACNKIGFSLDGTYKYSNLTPQTQDYKFSEETLEALINFGVTLDENSIAYIKKEGSTNSAELLCDIVLKFVKTQDTELELIIVEEKDCPMFQFYGFDEQKRHIGRFGYGLFK